MLNILVCEDETDIRKLVAEYLKREDYNVFEANDGEEALDVLDKNHIDLLITDIMMPHLDGITLSKELRESGYELPILMFTAKETIEDKKIGFSAGADDYLVKPVDMDEMLIRVSALLRRAKIAQEKKIVIGDTVLDYNNQSIIQNGNNIELARKEFQILFKLLSNPNRIFTRTQIMDEIWGLSVESDERTVDVHIKRIREKIPDVKSFDIVTVRGLGYKAVKNV